MAQRMRTVENLPEEAAELAEVASRLIEANPQSRAAFAELAALLGVGLVGVAGVAGAAPSAVTLSSLPFVVTLVAKVVRERTESRTTMTLPNLERQLWEDAGASFKPGAIEEDAFNAAAAFSDLLLRSLEGDISVARRLGVDRSRISQRVRDKSLYAFSHADTRFFPKWQFVDSSTLTGLRDVLVALDETLHPLVVDHWFTTPSVDLEVGDTIVSPVLWLETGGSAHVVAELAADL
jgi:hypothetical protein